MKPKPKYAQFNNRLSRTYKRISKLEEDVTLEKQCAKDQNREPATSEMVSQLHRLQNRQLELQSKFK